MRWLLPRLAGVALAAPPVLVILCVLGVAAAERAGARLFEAPPPANLAEAAATARGDDVVRRLEHREDPHRVYELRPEAISSTVLHATPLEAAVWSRQLRIVQLLDQHGVIRDGAERHAVACLAADLDVQDMVEYLSPGGAPACAPGEAEERVKARTRRPEDP